MPNPESGKSKNDGDMHAAVEELTMAGALGAAKVKTTSAPKGTRHGPVTATKRVKPDEAPPVVLPPGNPGGI